MMLDEAIGTIETAENIGALKMRMQRIAEKFGFVSYNFIDAGRAYQHVPYYFGTTGQRWENAYRDNDFVQVDPYVAKARRSNLPYDWRSIPVPALRRGPKPGARRLMEAAFDFGFREGLVVPYHFKDEIGRMHSTLCTFYWRDGVPDFERVTREMRHHIHLVVIYFMQRSMELIAAEKRKDAAFGLALDSARDTAPILTDRERDVLSWAGRGKTISETADILKLSEGTVETHVKNALAKLGAHNKTHAVAKCITLGLIDV